MTNREIAAESITEAKSADAILSQEEWRRHVVAAEKFRGSNVAYCRRHGLDLKEFRIHKRRARAAKRLARRQLAFVKIEANNDKAAAERAPREKPGLPDPAWTAQFLVALLRGLR